MFSIAGGDGLNFGGMNDGLLRSTVLDKGEQYRFDYQKGGGWSLDDPNADFYENFYKEKDLILPAGEYTVKVRGNYSLTENVVDSEIDLSCELQIKVG